MKDLQCALIDLSGINEMYQQHCNRKICGLLGSDFLLKYKAVINYERRILSLEKIQVSRGIIEQCNLKKFNIFVR
jgi:hypothetical protein